MAGASKHYGGERAGTVAYVNARLIDPATGMDEPGALVTSGGVIADLGPRLFSDAPPPSVEVVDCKGLILAPGLVDMRTQLREPGEEHKETIGTASAAASAGGVSTMVCLPNTDPVIDDVAGVEFVARRAREVKATKVFCYAAATVGLAGRELTEMGLLAETGAIAFTDGTRAIAGSRVMLRALSYAQTFGLLIVQHPEDPDLAANGAMNGGEAALRLGLRGIPRIAEVMTIERDLRLVEATGGRYHAAHISTKEAVEAIRRAKERELAVTCDTAPPYFTLNENAIGDYRTFAKLSPPLRTEEDRDAIVAGLADGTIDAIASDHAPHDQDSKRVPFAQAEDGIVGLETLLPLSLALVHKGRLGMADMIGKMTCGPAAILGLEEGRLRRGAPADLVLIDPDKPWRIDVDAFLSKSKNAPWEDMPVQGMAMRTVVEGRVLHDRMT